MKKTLTINYGINRKVVGKHVKPTVQHINGKLRIVGDWDDDKTHKRIMAMIRRRHPGWNVSGWALVRRKRTIG